MAAPHIAWSIWKERNNHIFQDKSRTLDQVFERAKHGLMENMTRGTSQGDQNSKIKKKERGKIMWIAPPTGWININFDRATKGNPSLVGCGSVIRDCNSNFIVASATPLGKQKNHMEEAMGAYLGFKLAKSMNFNKIWLEGDSMNIINCLKGYTKPLWTIENIILKAKDIIANCTKIHISHEYDECNAVEDSLVNIGVQVDEVIIFKNVADLKEDTKSKLNYEKKMHKVGSL